MVPEPIDYQRPTTAEATRCSLTAAVGFGLSLPGPVIGFALYLLFESMHVMPQLAAVFLLLLYCPMLLGLTLSLIGLRTVSKAPHAVGGRRMAVTGIICAILWIGLTTLYFGLLYMVMQGPGYGT